VGGKINDYTALCTELLTFFGRAGRGSLVRIGRKSTQLGIKIQAQQFGLDNLAAASKLLPAGLKLKAGIEANIAVWTTVYKQVGGQWRAHSEDRGDHWDYIIETCTMCVDREADGTICHVFTGHLIESVLWQMGKEYEIQETQCHAMGAPACVWSISKQPKE
jgi:predicted hydrocarbon binding protein